jgi:Xaa-Pro aminopeptidase
MIRSTSSEKWLANSVFPHGKLGLEFSRPGIPRHTLAILRHAFPENIKFVNGEPIIEEIRIIKTEEEIRAIKKAVEITELGMRVAIDNIKPGVTESDVVLEAEYAMRKAGGRVPVLSYVASGKRSCMAHHTPSRKVIEQGDVVALDIHGGFLGYCADVARTVVCGKIDSKMTEGYACLQRAVDESLAICRKGVKLTEIRKIFYKELRAAKDLKFLTGPIIHGVGIMNYEKPYFSFPFDDKGYPESLDANMVVAVSNIGLYSEEGWGLRIEDMARITDGEPEYPTHFNKEFLSL